MWKLPILTCEQLNVTTSIREERLRAWSLFLLAAMVRSFAHMLLGISDRNNMVLWPGWGGRAEFSLNKKNVRSVWFVVKRRGCCCNLSGGVALIVWFITNGMCVKNNTIIYVERASNTKRDCEHDLTCCLLPWCEALRICCSGFLIVTVVQPGWGWRGHGLSRNKLAYVFAGALFFFSAVRK